MHRSCSVFVAAAVGLVSVWGCATPTAGPVATLPVKGKVTYKGQALTSGTVRFEPDGMGREASGEIQPDGTFELSTYAARDGAVPGHHRVAVSGRSGKVGTSVPLKFRSFGSSQLETDVSPEKTEYALDLR